MLVLYITVMPDCSWRIDPESRCGQTGRDTVPAANISGKVRNAGQGLFKVVEINHPLILSLSKDASTHCHCDPVLDTGVAISSP